MREVETAHAGARPHGEALGEPPRVEAPCGFVTSYLIGRRKGELIRVIREFSKSFDEIFRMKEYERSYVFESVALGPKRYFNYYRRKSAPPDGHDSAPGNQP